MNKSISNIFQRVKSLLNTLIGYIKEHLTWGILCIIMVLLLFAGQITSMCIQIQHSGDPAYMHYATSSFLHMAGGWMVIMIGQFMPDSIKYKKIFNG